MFGLSRAVTGIIEETNRIGPRQIQALHISRYRRDEARFVDVLDELDVKAHTFQRFPNNSPVMMGVAKLTDNRRIVLIGDNKRKPLFSMRNTRENRDK